MAGSTIEIKSMTELNTEAQNLITQSSGVVDLVDPLVTTLNGLDDFDGLNISGAASVLGKNFEIVTGDLQTVTGNISGYAVEMMGADIDDFLANGVEGYLANVEGRTISLPSGLGNVHSYMGWQMITAKSSPQYKLREAAGMNFDEEGFGKIGDRYVVATTTTFGNVGDFIDVVQADGSVIKCIIGDIKSQADAGCNEWGHNNGSCVVEFVVDKGAWYGTSKTVDGYHPEWNQTISQIINKGNYFDIVGNGDLSTKPVSSQPPVNVVPAAAAVAPVTIAATTLKYSSPRPASTTVTVTNPTYTAEPPKQTVETITNDTNPTPVTGESGDPNIDISKYHNNLACGFEVTTGNTVYNLSDSDFELICAIVSAESDKSYDDALAVVSTILNRCEAPNWVASFGTNPVKQATAPNQFVVYQHGSYKSYMNGKAPMEVQVAVRDALAGVRNHKYLSFRSNASKGYSSNMITSTGNRYK